MGIRTSVAALAVLATVAASGCGLCRSKMCCNLQPACGATVDCGCDIGCGCEVECGCEPTCGCASACNCGPGRSWALRKWQGDGNCQGPKFNVCTGGCCQTDSTCGCETGCGCEPACGCADSACCNDPGCGCEPSCGCGSTCGCGSGCGLGNCLKGWGFLRKYNPFGCMSCGGCDCELYWSEWHNDPPRCCDPCDKCGNWIGPSSAKCCGNFPERVGSTTH